jgi:hypothetical protein
MENSQHDIHQFYFERYLRNKLSVEEKENLEKRLSEDTALQEAFHVYKQNRRQLVKELIREHDKGPGKSRISSFVYLVITIAGLILALNFYLENRALLAERKRDKNLITRLLENIPFVGKKNKTEEVKKQDIPGRPAGTSTARNRARQEPVGAVMANISDTLLHDTVLVPVSRKYIEQRAAYYRTEVDTSLSKQEILNLIYRNNHKYADKHKTTPIGVEFRRDAAGRSGYMFDGNKLVMFGIKAPYQLFLVKDENELVWLQADTVVIFVADNTFHTY